MDNLVDRFNSALIIENDEPLRNHMVLIVQKTGINNIETASTIQDTIPKLNSNFDLVFVSSYITDELCTPIIKECLRLSPDSELIIMVGTSDGKVIADLILEGADTYIERPLDQDKLQSCLASLQYAESPFERICKAQVGRLGFIEAQKRLREAMFKEAISQCKGNRSKTARMLGVDRRYVQSMVSMFDCDCTRLSYSRIAKQK